MRDMRVTHAMFVPSLLSTLSPEDMDLDTLKTLMIIGEKSPAHIVERWASIPGLRFLNAYGPAECTPVSSVLDMSLDGAIPGNIGRPMGASLWIVNPTDTEEVLPLGQEGELLIEGPLVGRGYMNEAKKTAAVFIPTPSWLKRLRNGDSTRVYRTGDLCRYNKDGTIHYIGRNDLQVKIRGQRMELGEVEHQLRRALPQTADLAVELAVKQSKLVAFISLNPINTQQSDSAVSQDPESISALEAILPDLKKEVSQSLPEYMMPSTYVAMDFIPRLASAKTDRNSLRALAASLPTNTTDRAEIRMPTSVMEEKLQKVWAEVFNLELNNIGIDDHFFQLGGDSITAIRMRLAARSKGVELTMKDVFDHPILAELATIARAAGDNSQEVPPFALVPKDSKEATLQSAAAQCSISESDIEDIVPAAMNACYFMLTSEAAPNWWTSFHTFPLPTDVDIDRYLNCWKSAISAYQNLRSRIIRTETAILQVILRKETETIRSADNLDAFIEAEKHTTMNWGQSLSRYCLVEDKKTGQRHFVWTAKQAIFDAWSLHLMSQNIAKAYYQKDFTLADTLKPNQLAKHKLTTDITPAKTWFKNHFAGVIPDPIFSTPPDYKFETDVYESREIKFGHSASSTGFTLGTVSAVAWALVLGQHTGSKDVCLGLVRSGRDIPLPSTDKYMGPLTSLMPLRVRIDGSTPVYELLRRYQSDFTESSAYDAWSYIEFIMDSEVEPRIKGAVTSTVSLNIVHPLEHEDSAQQMPPNKEVPAGATQKPLNLNVFLKSNGNVKVMTRRDHIACTKELAEAFVNSFELVAKQLMTAGQEATLGQLDVPDTSIIPRSYFPITNGIDHAEEAKEKSQTSQHDFSAAQASRTDLSALKGKSVLVTGGASGLGLASTRAFAAAGAYVTIADIQLAEETGAKLIEEFASQGQRVTYAQCDATNFASQVSAFKHAVQFAPTKSLDVVALFAGVSAEHGSIMNHLVDVTPSLEKDPPPPSIHCLNINLIGVYYSAYLALNYFRLPSVSSQPTDTESPPSDKSLIFINSLAGYLDFGYHTTYNASKFGARGIFRSIRSETKKIAVRCNLIAPWLVQTPLTQPLAQKFPGSGKGISWASVDDVVDCTGRMAVDETVNGEFVPFCLHVSGQLCLLRRCRSCFCSNARRHLRP